MMRTLNLLDDIFPLSESLTLHWTGSWWRRLALYDHHITIET